MRLRSFALLAASHCALLYPLVAQDLPDVAQGLQPYVAYHGGQLDQVNTLNGGLTVRIPLVSYPQRGSLSLSYSVLFNSFGFQDIESCIASPGGPIVRHAGCTDDIGFIPTVFGDDPQGPHLVADQPLQGAVAGQPQNIQVPNPPTNGRAYVVTVDNAEHPLGLATDGTWRSIDGSGFMFLPSPPLSSVPPPDPNQTGASSLLRASGTIVDSHGVAYTATGMTDTDGNSIVLPPGGLPATDSTGRFIPALSAPPNGISGCPTIPQAANQPLESALAWAPPGTGTTGYLFCYANVTVDSSYWFPYPPASTTQYHEITPMLQSIVLPNGTYWGFVYDSWAGSGTQTGSGQLMTLIYPTGGTVNYTYGLYEGFCDQLRAGGLIPVATITRLFAVATRTMTDAQGWSATWKYTYGQFGSSGSVLSPAGDLTVTKWTSDDSGGCGWLSAGESVYQGDPSNPATATPLKNTTITYTGVPAPDNGPPYVSDLRIQNETTVLNGTSSSSVQYGYGSVNVADLSCDLHYENCVAGPESPVAIGSETSKVYTDYSGAALKQDTTTYQWQNSPGYFTANLLDLPYITQTLDASGATYSKTTYSYDESSYSPGGIRGHPTTVTKWLNTSPSASPATHTGWNSYGMKSFVVDADGNKNSNGHTIDYQYNGAASCNGSEVTDTYDAVNGHVSGAYDCNSGRLTRYADQNGNSTTVSYDGLGRILSMKYPAITPLNGSLTNPITSFNYEDSSNSVVRTILATPDPTQTTTVTFDGFGREIHRYTSASPSQTTVDTTYDADGRVSTVSNPYYSTSDTTYGLTTYAYDPLNRKTQQTGPDGTSKQQWSYSGNVVTATDELGHVHQQTSDALGRLTAVLEPDPSTGALDLQTSYSYDPLNNLLAVYQQGNAANGDVPRTRSFTYDSLSRLLTSYNPESGWICYGTTGGAAPNSGNCTSGYDANGNLQSKTVLYSTASPPVTTIYAYDGLNRLIAKGYQNDPNKTPLSCFQYGLPTTGVSGANQIGRLMNAWTIPSSGSCASTLPSSGYLTLKAVLQYDAMGHIVSESQCAPSGCRSGGVPYAISYAYDLAGNLASSTNGITSTPGTSVPLAFTSAYDAAGRLSSVTSNWNENTGVHPTALFTATGYTAAGGLTGAGLGNGLTLGRTYNSRLWVTGETDTGGLVLNATPGTGSLTITGAEQSH